LIDKARSVKLQKTSIRSVIERDRNQRVLASIDSCSLSCRIVGIIGYILSDDVMFRNTKNTLLLGGTFGIPGTASLFRSVEGLHKATTDFPQVFLSLQNLLYVVYNIGMTTKEIALKTIEQLPANASWEDIQERINFVAAVRKGLGELDESKGITHDKAKEEFAEWLTE